MDTDGKAKTLNSGIYGMKHTIQNKRSLQAAVLLIMILACCSQSLAVPRPVVKKIYIAVLQLEGKGISSIEASVMSDKLRSELINTEKFQVIERSQMEEVLKEQGFQQTGCTSSECAVQAGQLIGVNKLIAGSVGKVGNMYLVSLRMIDVELGSVIRNVEEKVDGVIEDVLEVGIRNSARKMAGLKPDRQVAKRPSAAKQVVVEKKSRITAMLYSVLIPGLGQYYNGNVGRGVFYELAIAGALGGAFAFIAVGNEKHDEYDDEGADQVRAVQLYDESQKAYDMSGYFQYALIGCWAVNVLDAVISGGSRKESEAAVEMGGNSRMRVAVSRERAGLTFSMGLKP